MAERLRLRGPAGRPLRLAHLTTVDMSLALLLDTELRVDVESGLDTYGISAPGPYVERVEDLGVRHVALPSLTRAWSPRHDAAAAGELLAALRRLRPDVLHTHNPKTGVLGRMVGRLARVPVVVNTCHGLWAGVDDPPGKRAAVYGSEAAAAAFSHVELYQNAADAATLRRLVRQRTVRVVGNGTDLEHFAPDDEQRRKLRAELGVGDDDVLVGGVGRLVAEKGITEFAAAARTLRERATFVWIGPQDPAKPDAVRGDAAGVRFLGERTDMAAVYNALDVFVLPSYREGFSRSGMEAAACGTAMVLSDIRGCREIGRHDVELLLVPARDPIALTAAVDRLVSDPGLRQRLATAARRRALSSFDQRTVAAASLSAYASVAVRRRLDWQIDLEPS
ncbi:MAG: glycosyltransferase [Actinomycetota bacterium]|nr:glycosyltransferase [Actinomycetota bacterium]